MAHLRWLGVMSISKNWLTLVKPQLGPQFHQPNDIKNPKVRSELYFLMNY